jgi:pimeloyl-ACP methyl ester carboxylesterase
MDISSGIMRKTGWFALAAAMFASAMTAPSALADAARYYQIGAAKLYVETFGRGPPILFLHVGMMFFDNSFANQREYFGADHVVIGIDQRGHGHSPDGRWSLSYKLMADDTASALEQLGLGPVDVVGHSDGANVALVLARDHPLLVHRMERRVAATFPQPLSVTLRVRIPFHSGEAIE